MQEHGVVADPGGFHATPPLPSLRFPPSVSRQPTPRKSILTPSPPQGKSQESQCHTPSLTTHSTKKRENPRGKDEFRRARNATPPSTDGDRWRAQPISLNVTGRQAVFLGLSALGEARRDCCLSSERPVSPGHSSPPSRYTALFL